MSKDYSSIIRPKDEYQNMCFKKTKHLKFYEKQTFLGKKCSFFGKFDVLYFLEIPILRLALLPHCRCIANNSMLIKKILTLFLV